MNHIVALKGKGNSGKTETIKMVFTLLKNKYPKASVNLLKCNTKDVKVIMLINGHTVGIESQGDPNSRLQQSLIDFNNAKCDIIICATRSSGMTVNFVNSYSSTRKIYFIQQKYTTTANKTSINNEIALQIISTCGL